MATAEAIDPPSSPGVTTSATATADPGPTTAPGPVSVSAVQAGHQKPSKFSQVQPKESSARAPAIPSPKAAPPTGDASQHNRSRPVAVPGVSDQAPPGGTVQMRLQEPPVSMKESAWPAGTDVRPQPRLSPPGSKPHTNQKPEAGQQDGRSRGQPHQQVVPGGHAGPSMMGGQHPHGPPGLYPISGQPQHLQPGHHLVPQAASQINYQAARNPAPADLDVIALLIRSQIEHYFSMNNMMQVRHPVWLP